MAKVEKTLSKDQTSIKDKEPKKAKAKKQPKVKEAKRSRTKETMCLGQLLARP